MLRSAMASAFILMTGYTMFQPSPMVVPGASAQYVSVPQEAAVCVDGTCSLPAVVQSSSPVVSYPASSQVVYTSTSYGSTGSVATSYGSAGSAAYTASSRSYVRGQPLRNVLKRQPVRSAVRRVFCR